MPADKNINGKLAIVIPAYKALYLADVLESIANQTCKDFTVYIGNDNSPDDLYGIIAAYTDKFNLVYQGFENNLGGADLVAHWERCINMIRGEEWVWLFSDDDVMEPNCVALFYEYLAGNPSGDLLHFDIDIIDKDGNEISKGNAFPPQLSIADFFAKRTRYEINSTVVEYIFKKSKYDAVGGFKNYDLAWGADDATWIKLGTSGGIATIPGARVKWRYSGDNISSRVNDKQMTIRKLNSNIAHMQWVAGYFLNHNIIDHTNQFDKLKWMISVVITKAFSFKEKVAITFDVIKQFNYLGIKALSVAYLIYFSTKKRFIN